MAAATVRFVPPDEYCGKESGKAAEVNGKRRAVRGLKDGDKKRRRRERDVRGQVVEDEGKSPRCGTSKAGALGCKNGSTATAGLEFHIPEVERNSPNFVGIRVLKCNYISAARCEELVRDAVGSGGDARKGPAPDAAGGGDVARIMLTEGRYHHVKRMVSALGGMRVVLLRRELFGTYNVKGM